MAMEAFNYTQNGRDQNRLTEVLGRSAIVSTHNEGGAMLLHKLPIDHTISCVLTFQLSSSTVIMVERETGSK